MTLLQMSLSAGVLIAVLSAVRAAAGRLPKRLLPALWGLILVRLLVPFSFLVPIAAPAAEAGRHTAVGAGETALYLPDAAAGGGGDAYAAAAPMARAFPWELVWGTGAALCTLYFAVSYARCRGLLADSLPVENAAVTEWQAAHPLQRRMQIRQSGRLRTPMTYGVFRPVLLLPKGMDWSDRDLLRYILQHEYIHIRRFDAAAKLLLTAALCVHWFNPLVWLMAVLANRDLELSCDEAVIRAFGDRAKSAYALALIRMEERKSGLAAFASGFSKNAMEERVKAIMMRKKTSAAAVLAGILLFVVFTVGVGASGVRTGPAADPRPAVSGVPPLPARQPAAAEQSVTFESVELRYYDNGWPYLHDVFTNGTDRTIAQVTYAMLGYDREGNPLRFRWFPMDSSAPETYENETEVNMTLSPGQTYDVHGGWSLETGEGFGGNGGPNQVAYALYCARRIVFSDGSVWENPAFGEWLAAYRERVVEPAKLESYYPFRLTVADADIQEIGKKAASAAVGTEADYRSLLALQTADYTRQSVAEFDRALQDWANGDSGRCDRISRDLAQESLPAYLTAGERRFLALTVRASQIENAVQTKNAYSGRRMPPDISFYLRRETAGERPEWAELRYGFSYQMDPRSLTVGERDRVLAQAEEGVRLFWAVTGLSELVETSADELRELLVETLAACGTDTVQLGFLENYFLYQTSAIEEER